MPSGYELPRLDLLQGLLGTRSPKNKELDTLISSEGSTFFLQLHTSRFERYLFTKNQKTYEVFNEREIVRVAKL